MKNEQEVKERVDEIIHTLANNIIIIDDNMSSKSKYKELIETIFQYLRDGFEFKELREAPVYFKFHQDTHVNSMQLRHFLTNIIFWRPLIALDAVSHIDESFIVDTSRISAGYIKNYIDTKIVSPYKRRVSNKKLNIVIHDLVYGLSRISTEFNILLGLTMNIEMFIDVANKNPRFDEIIHTKVDDTLQPNVVEKQLHELMNEEINILKGENNAIGSILRSGSGIKHKQLAEMSINGGYKPDISGSTIPIPINTNLLVGGLANTTNYFIDAVGGRKSLIMSKMMMGKSGFFTKKAMLVTSGMKLRKELGGCNSVNPIVYELKTMEHVRRLSGRYFRTATMREFQILKGNESELVGQKIFVKAPCTCTSYTKGEGVCEHCYGPSLYHTNYGIDIGAYASAKSTNPVGQNILSTKHLLTTDSVRIEFGEMFDEFFTLSSNEVVINTDNVNLKNYTLILIKDNIVTLNELNEGSINEFVTIFHVRNEKTGEIYEFRDENATELFISPELHKEMGLNNGYKKTYEINLDKIDKDTRIFLIQIENNELTRPLYEIMGILDSKTKRKSLGVNANDVSTVAQKMLDLFIISNIDMMAIHGEIMITPLVRSVDDILERPNFAKYSAFENTQILTMSGALEKHPSPIIGMSFAYLERQLKSPLTYKKHGESFLDPFFRTRI